MVLTVVAVELGVPLDSEGVSDVVGGGGSIARWVLDSGVVDRVDGEGVPVLDGHSGSVVVPKGAGVLTGVEVRMTGP